MLQEITRDSLAEIRNPLFREYAEMYLDIYDNFIEQVEAFGVPFRRARDPKKRGRRFSVI